MTSEAITTVLIALATHRITRFATKDRIAETPRLAIQLHFEKRWEQRTNRTSDDVWGSKLAYLMSCGWCTSIYIAAAVTAGATAVTSVPLPILTALAASGVTGLLDELSRDG